MAIKKFLQRNLLGLWRTGSTVRTLRRFPGFLRDWNSFRQGGGKDARVADWFLRLHEATATTPFDAHYFYQSAWAARKISLARPRRHVDVGSQIDLIAPLSAFVLVEFVDLRPLEARLPGLKCVEGSILKLPYRTRTVHSLSSLHVVEHIGLGRYGDPVDPEGHVKACKELERVLARGGTLLFSVPVGRNRVEFNAHRVFAPEDILSLFPELRLVEFSAVDDGGNFCQRMNVSDFSSAEYSLGMYHFTRR